MALQEKETRKRKPVSNDVVETASDDSEDSDFELGLLDDELSSDEEDFDDSGDEAESESGENSDDEVEEEITKVSQDAPLNGESEDLLSDGSSEFYSSDGEVVLDAEGNPRKLLPEIDPHYDSDSSTYSEVNTIGNIDIEKYYPASMPHIGYDINGRRIMRPAAGAALDQLLDTIDLPKGWTGIIDKETGALKNLTEEELEIIKRIRKEELPNDQTEIYDVDPPHLKLTL
jgi:ribosome biogenesis protein ERB1